ncbi:MAG: hypothetical protein ACYTGC_01650 [Planctomycetota bacterium]
MKLFKGVESDIPGLEREINEWLQATGTRIVHIFGNIAPQTMGSGKTGTSGRTFEASDVFLAVVYESS